MNAYNNSPDDFRETSSEAEESIAGHIGMIQKKILKYMLECGTDGSTHQEAEQHFAASYGPSTIRARYAELEHAGFVVESGRHRRTRSGCRAIVWMLATLNVRA